MKTASQRSSAAIAHHSIQQAVGHGEQGLWRHHTQVHSCWLITSVRLDMLTFCPTCANLLLGMLAAALAAFRLSKQC